MMSLKNSSELNEAAEILEKVFSFSRKPSKTISRGTGNQYLVEHDPVNNFIHHYDKPQVVIPIDSPKRTSEIKPVPPKKERVIPVPETDSPYTEDKLNSLLKGMCIRGGFGSAIITDFDSLLMAEYGADYDTNLLVALSSILGNTLSNTSDILDTEGGQYLSVDINYIDKAVVTQFKVHDISFYLLIICPQETDEREEVEVSISSIKSVLE